MKVVINKCYGGFGLSRRARIRYLEKTGVTPFFYENVELKDVYYKVTEKEYLNKKYGGRCQILTKDLGKRTMPKEMSKKYFWDWEIERNDPILIEVIEEMKEEANGYYSELKIIEIPDNIEWEISEYDGIESVKEKHRSWY